MFGRAALVRGWTMEYKGIVISASDANNVNISLNTAERNNPFAD
jgi:hypothetical protein